MDKMIIAATALAGALALAGATHAQAPTTPPAAAKAPADYRTVMATIEIAKPVAAVMAKTGKWCDIAEWIKPATCVVNSGKDGELGANRLIAGRINEIFVAKTANSYTYAQPLNPNSYHGTVEYLPVMAGKGTKVVYTLFWDISLGADQAAKDKDTATRQATVKRFVDGIKAQAEK